MKLPKIFYCLVFILTTACQPAQQYQVIIRNGIIYDGSGGEPYISDIGINADTLAFIGDLVKAKGETEVDATGLAVSPGFINMLSWATESLLADGRSQSNIRQGVTLEVMGEGSSMGPLNPAMKKQMEQGQGNIRFDVAWTTLGEYLSHLEKKGVSSNVASFLGAGTVRTYVVGEEDRPATAEELDSMRVLVQIAMKEGALGIGTSLIYPPDFFASTEELIALCREAARFGGTYISHIRSEGTGLFKAVQELITIAREAEIHAEIYHLKAAGKDNWPKLDSLISVIETARAEGLDITADMYTYTAAGTGLTACFPPSMQDGGFGKLWERLRDPASRSRLKKMMVVNSTEWENFYYHAGPDQILLNEFRQDSLKKFTGKTLSEVAAIRGASPEETVMDLIYQDSSKIPSAYYLMSEENIRKQIVIPWVSFGSDEGSYTNEGMFLEFNVHPRAYGNFARVLGRYVGDEKLLTLQSAVHKLTKLPATNLRIKNRGELKVGYFADIAVFDPSRVQDFATFEDPHRYSVGVEHVFVNGVQVLKDGEHTGAMPGRFVKGPGSKIF
ncbi:MAG TPA: D-aminoacylase [Cyclobacteriaceae bacterium]|nr:D-aminoacylase [Cyclobacteriaceae bacterium]